MMAEPAVSFVMPVRDGARFIGEALTSVQEQTFADLELVVVDDGSTDGTREIVRRRAREDPRIRLVEQDYKGLPGALNTGLTSARAPWVARLDADDIAFAHRLERQLAAAARRPEVAVWASWALTVNQAGRVIGRVTTGPVTEEEFRRAHAAGFIEILHPTVLARRRVLLDIGGYDERFPIGEDVELWDRVGEVAPILTIPEPLIHFRIHPDSESTRRLAESVLVHRFVATRRVKRDVGDDLSWSQFQQAEATAPWLVRARRALEERAIIAYRRAGTAYAASRFPTAVVQLLIAFLLRPHYVAPRLWRQFLRPLLRGRRRTE